MGLPLFFLLICILHEMSLDDEGDFPNMVYTAILQQQNFSFLHFEIRIKIKHVFFSIFDKISNNISRMSSNCYVACNTMAALFRLPICTRFLTVMGSTNAKPVLCTNLEEVYTTHYQSH